MSSENAIDYSLISDSDNELINDVAKLHIEHLSYRSFITLFGYKFIKALYKDILKAGLGFIIVAKSGKQVCGFVLGCMDSNRLFKLIVKKFPKYLTIMMPQIIAHPSLIPKLFETLFYVKKEDSNIAAELIVIVTDSAHRSLGIGRRLVDVLNQEFLKREVFQYKVTVHEEMKRSNNFYSKIGMQLSSCFTMYGVKWNLYIKLLKNKIE